MPESPDQMDESRYQSQTREEFRQSAYWSEPDTSVRSSMLCLLNGLFCHFQSQFVTVTWPQQVPVMSQGGRKKKRNAYQFIENCGKVLIGCFL